jgi:hypothetical protein
LKKLKELIVGFSYKKGGRENLQVFLNNHDQALYKRIFAKKIKNLESKDYIHEYIK